MLIEHSGKRPDINPAAWVAPDATLCGDVRVGAGSRIMHGARLIGEAGGRIEIGECSVVLENAVIRASEEHPCFVGRHCIVGPHASITCALIGDEVLIGAGAVILEAAYVAHGSEIREHATVHVRTRVEPGTLVPIGWVAVGDPAEILPPHQHEHIWALQRTPDFSECARYQQGKSSEATGKIARLLAESLETHKHDKSVE